MKNRTAALAGVLALLSLGALAGCSDSKIAAPDDPDGSAPQAEASALVWGEGTWGEDRWNDAR